MTDAPVVSVVGVRAVLSRRPILQDLSLVVRHGEVVGVVGANGSGKSTLLRLIVGLVRPKAGTVSLFGLPPHNPHALRRVGATIDTPALYPWMSGRSVLRTLLDLSGEADGGRSVAALERFGLSGAGRRPVIRYSQGMKQRLALAASSLRGPELLLLDEPTNALDAEGREIVRSWIQQHRDGGGAAVIATHRAGDAQMCDRLVRLDDGDLRDISLSQWSSNPEAEI